MTAQETLSVTTDQVREFWEKNPLCATGIPHPLGSKEYFLYFNEMRERIESPAFANPLHEFRQFRGRKVLDVGSGNGWVLSKYAEAGAEVFGVDVTQQAVDLCRQRFGHFGLRGDFRVADAQDLPFEDATFDCACSMGVLHHVPDTRKAIAEIHRVLKPGGRLIVMFYHRNSAKYQWNYRVSGWLQGRSMQQLVNEFDGVGNPKGSVFSKKELAGMLGAFEAIEMTVGYLQSRDIFIRGHRFVPDNLFRPFERLLGWNLYAKARKPL